MQNLAAQWLPWGLQKVGLFGTCFQVEMKKGASELRKLAHLQVLPDEHPVFLAKEFRVF